ncbi:hypothetical protein [Zhihengliuella halotolerans]|uniref:hypothetical protein n=1 Tax=Zhihengliuella halotolerans TaxID=370736 RepID=UPI00102AA042|nr:hypothetical protein [Zhihengliuella halotolerans]
MSVTLITVLHSEWIKFRTLASYPITTFAVLALIVGMGLLETFSLVWAGNPPSRVGDLSPGQFLNGMQYAYVLLGVLAVVFMASEYTQATMQPSLLATPKRLLVLAAKSLLMGMIGLGTGVLGSTIVLLVVPGILSGQDLRLADNSADIVRFISGSGISLGLMAMLGVGLAALIRSLVAAFITVVSLLTVAPIAVSALPVEWVAKLMAYMPTVAGSQYLSSDAATRIIEPWWGLVILAGWALAILVAGSLVLRYRDA